MDRRRAREGRDEEERTGGENGKHDIADDGDGGGEGIDGDNAGVFFVGSRSRGSRPIALSLRCAASVRRNMSDNGGNWISCLRVPTVSCHSRRVRATGLARARHAIRITSPERLEIGSRTFRATLFCRRVRAAGHRRVCALSRHSRRVRATCLARTRYAIRTAEPECSESGGRTCRAKLLCRRVRAAGFR